MSKQEEMEYAIVLSLCGSYSSYVGLRLKHYRTYQHVFVNGFTQ